MGDGMIKHPNTQERLLLLVADSWRANKENLSSEYLKDVCLKYLTDFRKKG